MIWHGFPTSRINDAAYWSLPRATWGIHHAALLKCALVENGGIWRDAAAWSERDWLHFAGIDLAELEALASAGLAWWLTREESSRLLVTLEPSWSDEALRPTEPARWEQCRVTVDAIAQAVGECAIRDRSDALDNVPGIEALRQLDLLRSKRCVKTPLTQCFDLCIADYDFGGQLASQRKSELGKKNADLRWGNRATQQVLNFPEQRIQRNASIPKDPEKDPGIDAIPYAQLQHRSEIPPYPPLRGGDRGAAPPAEGGDPRERLWAWVRSARPAALSGERWGGAKVAAFRTLDATAALLRVPVGDLCERVIADLHQKFGDRRWCEDSADARSTFRSYVRNRDFEAPLVQRTPLTLVGPAAVVASSSPEERGWPGPPMGAA